MMAKYKNIQVFSAKIYKLRNKNINYDSLDDISILIQFLKQLHHFKL
jgi:hypothetical protein